MSPCLCVCGPTGSLSAVAARSPLLLPHACPVLFISLCYPGHSRPQPHTLVSPEGPSAFHTAPQALPTARPLSGSPGFCSFSKVLEDCRTQLCVCGHGTDVSPGWGLCLIHKSSQHAWARWLGVGGQLEFPRLVVVRARLCFRLWCHPEGGGQLRGAKQVGGGPKEGQSWCYAEVTCL